MMGQQVANFAQLDTRAVGRGAERRSEENREQIVPAQAAAAEGPNWLEAWKTNEIERKLPICQGGNLV